MPADIGDVQRQVVVVQTENIEKVAGQFLAGSKAPGKLGARNVRQRCGEQRLLDGSCRLQIAAHPLVSGLELFVPFGQTSLQLDDPLPGSQADSQLIVIERFAQKVPRARFQINAPSTIIHTCSAMIAAPNPSRR